ncbi:Dabb family protein [Microbacterium sp. LWS13-1.2]|uniref:Dabb family protein n=1 Tax=Microbacterium sp. LWS13-1.2 TaxID=3135264 RepID=A0AAU6SFB5_9MICO
MTFRHIVLFRVHDDVDIELLDRTVEELDQFAHHPGVVSWIIRRSLDERKGRVIVEDATFENQQAFERFRTDPAHVRAGRRMAQVSDWWVGDYLTEIGE